MVIGNFSELGDLALALSCGASSASPRVTASSNGESSTSFNCIRAAARLSWATEKRGVDRSSNFAYVAGSY